MERILIVDDAADIRLTLSEQLRYAGYEILTADSGAQATEIVRRIGLPDLVLLDIMLPKMNGFAIADMLHEMGDVPIIFLSARTDTDTKVTGLAQYGEDYLTKPVDSAILLARVARVLNRHPGPPPRAPQEVKLVDGICASFEQRYLIIDGRRVDLTRTETKILQTLYQSQGQAIPHERLLTGIATPGSLFVHIRRLRNKIEPDPSNPQIVQTVRGEGYVLSSI